LLNKFAFKQYKKHLKLNGRPDVIHAHSVYYGGLFARSLSAKLKVPFILTEHLTDLITENTISTYDLKLAKQVFLAAKKNLAVSSYFQKELAERFNLPISTFDVLPNMVDELFYLEFKQNSIPSDNAIRFFSNAFLSERKNIKLQLMAFDLFHAKFPHSKIYIGGDSVRAEDKKYHQSMLQLRNTLASKDSIVFTGALSRWDVKRKLDECHVFLLSSNFESFGVVLIEAMACGRPVITTDCKGPSDIVSTENGIVVKSSRPEDFCSAMESITIHYTKYNQEAIRKEAIQKYSGDSIARRLIDIYTTASQN
jgi:glycosyltransferase involved in cell wall biosynthesis